MFRFLITTAVFLAVPLLPLAMHWPLWVPAAAGLVVGFAICEMVDIGRLKNRPKDVPTQES